MARPRTKQDLIQAAGEQYQTMLELIASLPEEAQTGFFQFDEATLGKEAHWKRDKNIRDVLIHLYEWHQLFLNWVQANENGGAETKFLPEPYNWKTYGEMNQAFWERHQDTAYADAKQMLDESHAQVMRVIASFSDEALFTKGVLNWTGGSTLGSYGVSVTASHYEWGCKKLKKYKKTLG